MKTPRQLKKHQSKTCPSRLSELEREILGRGVCYLAGVDEVGRGCLAGPVVAACVIWPVAGRFPRVADSKSLSPKVREQLFEEICSRAVACSIAAVSAQEIDQINIHRASLKAMKLAVERLAETPDYLLIDGRFRLDVAIPQRAVVRGDASCQTIAAASIVAKVWRDRWMRELKPHYPQFGFEKHKGYATQQHRDEIRCFGATDIHRRSFRGVSEVVGALPL